jgi:hypothetical protein
MNRKGLGKNKGMGYKNLIKGYDAKIHSNSAKGHKLPQKMNTLRFGGKAADRTDEEKELIEATDAETLKQIQKELGFKDGDITSFREEQSGVYEFDIGNQSYYLFDDEDTAEKFAKDRVLTDLDENPEMFVQDWLEGHIDKYHLRDQLESDVSNSNYDYYNDIASESDREYQNRQIAELVDAGYLDDEDVRDKDGELLDEDKIEGVDKAIEEAVEKKTEEELEDPLEYLENIYGKADAMKEAIKIAGINEDEAADDAISQDGWQHFVASYDGNSIDLPNGKVLVRTH